MRDDVNQLLHQLQAIMDHTLTVLHDIHYNNSQIDYFIRTDNHSSLSKFIEENNHRFDTLASLRFNAVKIKDQLAAIFNVSPDELYDVPWNDDNPEWSSIINRENEIYNLMERVVTQNDDMVKKMESLQDSIKKDIRSLNITLKWHEKKDSSL